MGRTLIVGDVHGCLEELDELLTLAELRPTDRLVFVGDLLDRGPDPVGVVRRVRELGALCCYGNHEDKHVRWARHEAARRADPAYRNPMKSMSAEEAAQHRGLREEDVAWLAALPSYLALEEGWLVVHAGFEPRRPLERQKRAAMARVRWVDAEGRMTTAPDPWEQPAGSRRWAEAWEGPGPVVYGHHVLALDAPRVDHRGTDAECWGIDTGCCFGGRLTALELPGRRVLQAEARRTYQTRRPPVPTPR